MSQLIFDDNMEVPEEREVCLPSERRETTSPRTKASKLWLDKGYVKQQDKSNFILVSKCKSSINVCTPLKSDTSNCSDLLKMIRAGSNKHFLHEQAHEHRSRINSVSGTGFQLVPLLRKVSWEPDSSFTSLKFGPTPDGRSFDRSLMIENVPIYDDGQEDSDSISDESLRCVVITIGDVQPAKLRARK